MNFNFKTIHEFNDYFKDEKSCYEFLENLWWQGVPVCPHCGGVKSYKVKPRGKFQDIPSYRCSHYQCDLPFTIRTGSIFEGSKVELRKWFQAAYEITTSKKGISSVELGTRIGVAQKTSWLINHKIRTMLARTEEDLLGGMVQSDEAYFGGKEKNKHANKRTKGTQGRSTETKTPVVGLSESGKVRTFVVEKTDQETLHEIINANVEKDSTVVTDGLTSYLGLSENFNHVVVKHNAGEYVVEIGGHKFHTNNIENFWSVFKRGYIGIYHWMSPKHLPLYCNEFATRYNQRKEGNVGRFLHVVKNSGIERVTYAVLTGK